MSQQPEERFIKAAGGLVWRETQQGQELLVIHRPRYNDWTIPKGKLDPGESWPEAARREVAEETGFAVTFQEFAGVTTYYHGKRPKVVLFWNMIVADQDSDAIAGEEAEPEVDQVRWIDGSEAANLLTYPAEAELVAQNLAGRR